MCKLKPNIYDTFVEAGKIASAVPGHMTKVAIMPIMMGKQLSRRAGLSHDSSCLGFLIPIAYEVC